MGPVFLVMAVFDLWVAGTFFAESVRSRGSRRLVCGAVAVAYWLLGLVLLWGWFEVFSGLRV